MRRRDTLRKFAGLAAVGGVASLAGCSGGGGGDQSTDASGQAKLDVKRFDDSEGENGNLVVAVTVENAGTAKGSGTLYVTVEAGDDVTRKSVDVTVPAGETKTYDVNVGLDYGTFVERGSLQFDLRT